MLFAPKEKGQGLISYVLVLIGVFLIVAYVYNVLVVPNSHGRAKPITLPFGY